jgi:hypothetical protein
MSNELANIIQNNSAIVQTGLDEDTLAVAGGNTGSGSKRISIRGKNFHKVVNGKEVATVEENYMDVIIVKMAHTAARTYYASTYKEGERVSPACWSGDSNNPDSEVENPQAKSCNECPQSVKGSGMGGQGSACRLSWRIAVVLPNDPSGDVLQMVLPATSAFGKEQNGKYPFRPYIQMLANNNVSAGRVVTRMQFDAKSSVPKLLFSPIAAVQPEDVELLQKQSKSPAAESAIKMTVYQSDTSSATQETTKPTVEADEVEEPQVVAQAKAEKAKDITDIMDKWGVKD